jgi:ribulose-5-phosphate 4-epimerase/fuculose-1-phosphate aldolase
MLRNHGLLTIGQTVADAFVSMDFFEASCMIQLRAQAGGAVTEFSPRIVEGARQQWRQMGNVGSLAWQALLRKLDATDPGFRS